MKYVISVILVILTFGCTTTQKESNSTFFGGEIINPKNNFVLFLRDDKVVDTLLLDKNNRFLKEYNSLKEGLYTFKHGLEFQYIYLEPTDSILIRLNTWDFDESLVFNGKGSNKNEFLINLFLQNEKEENVMYDFFNLEETDFQNKIDSLASQRETIFKQFTTEEVEVSEGFETLTSAAIHMPLYRLKEVYPFYYKRAHKLKEFNSISDSFYNFRNDVDFNKENLISFYPYQNYIVNYLYNLSYQLKEKDPSKDNITLNVLELITKKIDLAEFKNTLLKRIIVNDFLNSETTCSINESALDFFLKNCSDEDYIKEVNDLVNDSKVVLNNEPLKDFDVISYDNKVVTISEIIKGKKTVIYFWSTQFMSSEYLVKRINYLEKRFPTIQFIGINLNPNTEDITTEHQLKMLNISTQFKLTKDSYANSYLTSNHPRSIIIDENGIVKNGFTYIDSHKFSSELNKIK